MHHPADRLLDRVRAVGSPTCVGLDPVLERIPEPCRAGAGSPVEGVERFCRGVIEAIAGRVPACKFQSACFERHGADGVALLDRLCALAMERELHVILDFKRGDIGISAAHYAASADGRCDWLTANPYLGVDGLEPFIRPTASGRRLGAFALVRTSNPGGDAIQSLRLEDGRTVAQSVADLVAEAGEACLGGSGYSALGAVVGATKAGDAVELRRRMPRQIFLVPGFGAQGGGIDDVLACFNPDGLGALVTASRSVIYAFEDGVGDWQAAVEAAATEFSRLLAAEVGAS